MSGLKLMAMFQAQTIIEPFKVKVVEPLPQLTREERAAHLVEAKFNVFTVPADTVTYYQNRKPWFALQ